MPGDWSEDQHPRDGAGKFSTVASGASKAEAHERRQFAALKNAKQSKSISEIMEETKARNARIKKLAEDDKPSEWKKRNGGQIVVSKDPSKPGRWRATVFDEEGTPTGHSEAADHEGALKVAYELGADFTEKPERRKVYAVFHGLAKDKMDAAIVDWIHAPDSIGKAPIFEAYKALNEKQRDAWDGEVENSFRDAFGESVIAYRYKAGHDDATGKSLSTEAPTYLAKEKYSKFRVKPEHVLAHYAQEDSPLSRGQFKHEKEIILRADAKPERIED